MPAPCPAVPWAQREQPNGKAERLVTVDTIPFPFPLPFPTERALAD
ncbi:MAG: hypothetical protein GVY22_01190 [Gammaproteobacteria bacterium]|jgi:hypothetical protein|nr:hypothetical protein [Gammaproteobacteria bacterium]